MRLKDWIKETGLKQSDFAKLVGVTPSRLSRIIHGSLTPPIELIIKIEDVTKGRVSLRDWKKPVPDGGESAIPKAI